MSKWLERFSWKFTDSKSCLEVYGDFTNGEGKSTVKFEWDSGELSMTLSEWEEFKSMVDEIFEANSGYDPKVHGYIGDNE